MRWAALEDPRTTSRGKAHVGGVLVVLIQPRRCAILYLTYIASTVELMFILLHSVVAVELHLCHLSSNYYMLGSTEIE